MHGVIVNASTARSQLWKLIRREKEKIEAGRKPGYSPDVPVEELDDWEREETFWKQFDAFVHEAQIHFPPTGITFAIRPFRGGFYVTAKAYEQYKELISKHIQPCYPEEHHIGTPYWSVSYDMWMYRGAITEGMEFARTPTWLVDRKRYYELLVWHKVLPETGLIVLSPKLAQKWGIYQSDPMEYSTLWLGFDDVSPFE